MRYRSLCRDRDTALIKRLKALGEEYPRYGYLMLHGLLNREGLVVNRKRTYRLYTALGMQVRTRKRKKLILASGTDAFPMHRTKAGRWILSMINWPIVGVSERSVLSTITRGFYWLAGGFIDLWGQDSGVKLHFIPGKPTQNAFMESFNARFRDSCLNLHWFKNLDDARLIIQDWRQHYNHVRPHSSLGYQSPVLYE